MTLWVAVLAACALSFALKLSGFLLPPTALAIPWVQRATPLLPVALLSALIIAQTFVGEGGALVLGLAAASNALVRVSTG